MTVLPVYNVLALPEASLYLKTELMKRMTGRQPHADERSPLHEQAGALPAARGAVSVIFLPIGNWIYHLKKFQTERICILW